MHFELHQIRSQDSSMKPTSTDTPNRPGESSRHPNPRQPAPRDRLHRACWPCSAGERPRSVRLSGTLTVSVVAGALLMIRPEGRRKCTPGRGARGTRRPGELLLNVPRQPAPYRTYRRIGSRVFDRCLAYKESFVASTGCLRIVCRARRSCLPGQTSTAGTREGPSGSGARYSECSRRTWCSRRVPPRPSSRRSVDWCGSPVGPSCARARRFVPAVRPRVRTAARSQASSPHVKNRVFSLRATAAVRTKTDRVAGSPAGCRHGGGLGPDALTDVATLGMGEFRVRESGQLPTPIARGRADRART